MKRFAIVGIVALAVLFLGTCGADLSDGNEGRDPEYSDWEYTQLPNGTAQLTIQLDGTTPFQVASGNRALNLGIAKRSHDYFEAVFISGAVIARAAWEIGQPAGIRGVQRGQNYQGFNDPGAIVCVGKKEGGSEGRATLLGVGFLSHVDGVEIGSGTPAIDGTIFATTRNVTFTVSALTTEVGYVDFDAPALTLHQSFVTSALPAPLPAIPASGSAGLSTTQHAIAQFKGGATFTIFGLPAWPDPVPTGVTTIQVGALYSFLGFTSATMPIVPPATVAVPLPTYAPPDLSVGLKHWPTDAETNPTGAPDGNFQVMERVGIYMANGQTYDVPEALDTVTTVKLDTSYAATGDTVFKPNIPLVFTISKGSGGVFAFTFQTPVYAMTKSPSTNGGPDPATWYIRPAYGQQQYLLDNGKNVGGAVLMGVGIGAMDWLDIYIKGFGFTNTTPITTP